MSLTRYLFSLTCVFTPRETEIYRDTSLLNSGTTMAGINIIYGGGRFGNIDLKGSGMESEDGTDEQGIKILNLLKKHNVNVIDSGKVYGHSEVALGRINDGSFLIDTKWAGGTSPPMTAERVLEDAKDSVAKLGKVGTFYFHVPDPSTPVEEQLAGVDEAYKAGLFTRFGLSNYQPGQVQEVYDVAKAKGYVLPTVYQGMYSPVNRKTEELLPLLRRLGISFNAYSPLAGGFLTKTRGYVQQGKGRFAKTVMYGLFNQMYNNEACFEALDEWEKVADKEGVGRADLAYRWVCYHSSLGVGDGMIIGGRLTQLEAIFSALNDGPLSEEAALRVDGIWQKLAPETPYLNASDALAVAMQGGAKGG